jgi:8-oxo-dGTP pyrophosphatase MutT (NUDIX family)
MVNVGQIRLAAAETLSREPITPGPGRAAVAMVLRDGANGAEVLLIRRAEREGDPWSGHIGLPGGRWESADESLVETAIRETREEVGIELAATSEALGSLATIPAVARGRRTGLTITPFLFVMTGDPALKLNDEVAETLWVPLDVLRDRRFETNVEDEAEGRTLRFPAWEFGGHVIWGLTHAMLAALLALLPPRGPKPPSSPAPG